MHQQDELAHSTNLKILINEINVSQELNKADIGEIFYTESKNCKTYCTTLRDGDRVSASFFTKGPGAGCYDCILTKKSGAVLNEIPLEFRTFHLLHDLYNEQNKQ